MMKKLHRIILPVLLAVAPVFAAHAATRPAVVQRADVLFFEPAKFTDFRDSYMGDAERTTYAEQIRDHLNDQARFYVPLGQMLQVTFIDIDMAGDFEPWRGPQFDQIRIVKDLYPPRMVLAFRLVDAEGNVLKEGRRELRDISFMLKLHISMHDTLRHEKALLDDWLRAELPRVRKT